MRRCILIALLTLVGPAGALAQSLPTEQLANARRLFDSLNYEQATAALDQVVAGAPAPPIKDAAAAGLFATAYELRGRARFFLGDEEGARSDFRALLKIAPGHRLPQVSAKVKAVFEEVARSTVGTLLLTLTPPDQDLELDGVPIDYEGGPIAVLAGTHAISARRSGCRPASREVTVAAGATQEVSLALERVSAALQLVTVPPGVEVVVDGVPRGRTAAGPLRAAFADVPATLGVSPDAVSRPFVLDDLPLGTHAVQFRLACHTAVERQVTIDRFDDYRIDPVQLARAVASVSVESATGAAMVHLDGEARGAAPLVLDDVCEGSHVVELRAPWGRYVERVNAHTGDRIAVRGAVRPAVAVLAVNGLPEGYRGPDLRVAIERALGGTRSVSFFAPSAEKVHAALKAEALAPGWLAFDRARRPMSAAASAISGAGRLELARRLARSLEVQGLAEATLRPGGDRNQFLLTVLSSESAQPDVLELTLENAASVNAAVVRLDAMPAFYRPSVGVSVADVLDLPGPVVIGVEGGGGPGRGGLAVGDTIVKVDGQAVADARGLAAALGARQAGQKLVVEARDRAGAAKRAELSVSMVPRLLAIADETWTFNSLVPALRAMLTVGGQANDPAVRLHLAAALMHVGNWADARTELGRVSLPPGPGVSNGTVQYLLGLCHEALGEPAEAERAFRAAASDAESLLTEDGPGIRELVERKLGRPSGGV